MNTLHAYTLLKDACDALDATGDHAVAAYAAQGMALLEEKYGIDPEPTDCVTVTYIAPPAAVPQGETGAWA